MTHSRKTRTMLQDYAKLNIGQRLRERRRQKRATDRHLTTNQGITEPRISFFVGLARHLQEKHLDTEINPTQQLSGSKFTLSQSTSTVGRRPNAIIATEKGTGRTTVPENPRHPQQEKANESPETVKYDFINLHAQDYEYENSAHQSSTSFFVGSLKNNFNFWKETLKANNFVLNVVSSGYLIPFSNSPSSAYLKNNQSAKAHASFVEQAINKLLSNGAVVEVKDHIPFIVNPLTVSVNTSGKERLILDLRHVNQFVEKQKFKFEGVPEALNFVIENGYMFKYDLTSGYHHIQIHEDHQTYLGFAWNFDGKVRHFVFQALPFGLSTAGHVFSKVLRPLVKYWRSDGHRVIMYLDDGWGIHEEFDSCKSLASQIRQDLLSAGFFVNEEKSVWEPTQKLVWLGFLWDLESGSLIIPKDKIDRFKTDLLYTIENIDKLTARRLAKITGKIISFTPSFGNICRIMSRNMLMQISTARFWDEQIFLTLDSILEIKFWLNSCDSLQTKTFFTQKFLPEHIVYTDASSFACAGFSVNSANSVVHKMWSPEEAKKSSTYRELKAVSITLRSLIDLLSNRTVKLFTDNQNVVRIISAGSMKSELQDLAIDIFYMCLYNGIVLEAEWVPREKNVIADSLSKVFDFDDWCVTELHFHFFNKMWGEFTCDIFADANNHKLSKFFSPYWCPGTAGVDAFSFDWSHFNCWLVPPVKLVAKTIKHLSLCRGYGTLVIPKWTSSNFWPLLWSVSSNSFIDAVKDSVEYVKPSGFFEAGSDKNSIFASSPLTFNVLVLRVDFSRMTI